MVLCNLGDSISFLLLMLLLLLLLLLLLNLGTRNELEASTAFFFLLSQFSFGRNGVGGRSLFIRTPGLTSQSTLQRVNACVNQFVTSNH